MRKVNIPMVLACVLLLLTMVSVHLTSGLYARYTTTAAASDSARVAKFDVRATAEKKVDGVAVNDIQNIQVDCTEGDKTGAHTITVSNQSEVAVKYKIHVMPKNVVATDLKFWWEGTKIPNISADMYFTRGPLAPGASAEYTFEFGIEDWHTVTGKTNPNETAPESFDWELNFDIVIDVWQVD